MIETNSPEAVAIVVAFITAAFSLFIIVLTKLKDED